MAEPEDYTRWFELFVRRGMEAQRAVDAEVPRAVQAHAVAADGTYRVRCSVCGTSVSSPLPLAVIVRAWVECPECLQKRGG